MKIRMNTERVGQIILDELCDGHVDTAIRLMTATRRGPNADVAELDALTEWLKAQR